MFKRLKNISRAICNILTGHSISKFSTFFRPRYFLQSLSPWKKITVIEAILSGYPRTGTHWLRNVIEEACGIETYDFDSYQRNPAEVAEVPLLKIHARSPLVARLKIIFGLPPTRFTGKYIYTYRDPRDAIISLYEMYQWYKDTDLTPQEFVKQYDPIGQYQWEIKSWVLSDRSDIFCVRFEEMKEKPEKTFSKIMSHLDLQGDLTKVDFDKQVGAGDDKDRPRGTVEGWRNAPKDYSWLIETVSSQLRKEIEELNYSYK